jgi:hypothetical protein
MHPVGIANQVTSFVDTVQSRLDMLEWPSIRLHIAAQFRKLRGVKSLKLSANALKAYRGAIAQKVSLIERLPSRYRAEVIEVVWISVMKGYDQAGLAHALHDKFGFLPDRAQKIAATQCKMAKSIVDNATRQDSGLLNAVWNYSPACACAGHPAFHRQRYNLRTGANLDGKWVLPGSTPDCECTCAEIGAL